MANPTQENLKELVAKYHPRVKSFIRKSVLNKEDAEDIAQDVFYQLVKAVNTTINPIENISAWLYRVAHNMIINSGKKKREEELPYSKNDENDDFILNDFSEILLDKGEAESPEMEYLRALVWKELDSALSELPQEQRSVFELTEFEGHSLNEISKTTGISVNTLLSRKHYAVLYLRKRLEDLYNDLIYF